MIYRRRNDKMVGNAVAVDVFFYSNWFSDCLWLENVRNLVLCGNLFLLLSISAPKSSLSLFLSLALFSSTRPTDEPDAIWLNLYTLANNQICVPPEIIS